MKINLNDFISIKLTDYGKQIYSHYYDGLVLQCPQIKESVEGLKNRCDTNNYIKMSLHEFMNMFGEYAQVGVIPFCENNTIFYKQRNDKWKKMKEFLNELKTLYEPVNGIPVREKDIARYLAYKNIEDKMQELEKGESDE